MCGAGVTVPVVKYDPARHHRRSIRLAEYDYASPGAYFVTICTYERELVLERADTAAIVKEAWNALPEERSARPFWQRDYYERVLRDDRELNGARQYIQDNPLKWQEDPNNPHRQTAT